MNDPGTRARRRAELRELAEKLGADGRTRLARGVMAFSTTMSVDAPSELARLRRSARRAGSE